MVQAVADAMNFKPKFKHPGPNLWGDELPNGTTIGMLGRSLLQFQMNKIEKNDGLFLKDGGLLSISMPVYS